MKAIRRMRWIAATVASLLVASAFGATIGAATPLSSQKLGLTRWSVNGASALDGLGSIVAVANVPAPRPGQATENRWSLAHTFSFVGDARPFGVISLDIDGDRRYATLGLNTGTVVAGVRRVEYGWQADRAYLPLAVVSPGSLTGYVYDFSLGTWSTIGSVPLPTAYGRISPVSATYLWWYGAGQPDCSSYPRVDHYRYTPLGVVNGKKPQSLPSAALVTPLPAPDARRR